VNDKSLVLLSSGLDSTVNLYCAHRDGDVALALTFDYGQRAASKEVACSKKLCQQLGLKHLVVDLPWFYQFTTTSLVNHKAQVPCTDQGSIDNKAHSVERAKQVWVPNRNGIFLNIAAGFAEGRGAQWVVPGFNAEEGDTFSDNTPEYLEALNHSFSFSTATGVKAKCYTTAMTKTEIVVLGKELGIPFDLLWPCYHGGESWCGQCESCWRFKRAMGEG